MKFIVILIVKTSFLPIIKSHKSSYCFVIKHKFLYLFISELPQSQEKLQKKSKKKVGKFKINMLLIRKFFNAKYCILLKLFSIKFCSCSLSFLRAKFNFINQFKVFYIFVYSLSLLVYKFI